MSESANAHTDAVADEDGMSPAADGESGVDVSGKETGREDTGTQGPADRSAGKSTGKDITGINPSKGGTMESEV